ncbi:unnamed protein product [Bursaphelenchus okinawaensis]|uniref:Uncharacterized protein n=1 Tax=Bursaphelenchus okinawaensis TaxID=465554 RepID=A0A811KJD7_9BILA|nr:unnamed protein product [Bursaphelenchus okinawaensis]CAG9104466.1 unnamed protein product [Bursaphelenchus okinawaensis]
MTGDEKHGVYAVFKSKFVKYVRSSNLLPCFGLRADITVKYDNIIVKLMVPPIHIKIKLVTINKIEVNDKTCSLTIGGRGFDLTLQKVNTVEGDAASAIGERLRFLVLRQRIPHSILGLPFEWEMECIGNQRSKIRWNGVRRPKPPEYRIRRCLSDVSLQSAQSLRCGFGRLYQSFRSVKNK